MGHSYGGAVITVAGTEDNVQALVYLAGYALEKGESLGELQGRFPDSDLAAALVYTPFPLEGSVGTGTDVSVQPDKFPPIFAADVDRRLTEVLAVSQRPLAAQAFADTAPAAAWKTKPSWGLVAYSDHTINPDVQRYGYQRAGMTTVEVDSSHLVDSAPQDRPASRGASASHRRGGPARPTARRAGDVVRHGSRRGTGRSDVFAHGGTHPADGDLPPAASDARGR